MTDSEGRRFSVGDQVRTGDGIGTVVHAGQFKGVLSIWVSQPMPTPVNSQHTRTLVLRPCQVVALYSP
ncbi:hypothetical protein ABIA32_004939 [Streptacidiphilus sp. MAP12-20]|uniref:hypothetical protein n=1 Tax=Streptacidiphilus sp. MAP12-20 TaxID=3156299 RepID=UPI003514185B